MCKIGFNWLISRQSRLHFRLRIWACWSGASLSKYDLAGGSLITYTLMQTGEGKYSIVYYTFMYLTWKWEANTILILHVLRSILMHPEITLCSESPFWYGACFRNSVMSRYAVRLHYGIWITAMNHLFNTFTLDIIIHPDSIAGWAAISFIFAGVYRITSALNKLSFITS